MCRPLKILTGLIACGLLAAGQRLPAGPQDACLGAVLRAEFSLLQYSTRRPPANLPSALCAPSPLAARARTLNTPWPARPPGQVALLVPLQGPYGHHGQALRDGVLAAWYRAPAARPTLRIYDTGAGRSDTIYARAVAEGADLVLGPLTKTALQQLLLQGPPRIPTLALNSLGTGRARPNLVHYALGPDQHACQAARRATADGYRRALVVHPAGRWGRKTAHAFRQCWPGGGKAIAATLAYPPGENNLRPLTARLLAGWQVAGPAAPDVLFLSADAPFARRFLPELDYHGAGHLPVYAMPMLTGGRLQPGDERDLAKLRFLAPPWLLSPDHSLREQMGYFASAKKHPDLFAMGYDAYHLAGRLPRLTGHPDSYWPGAGGRQRVLAGRVHSRLDWAEIKQGAIRPLPPNGP